MPESKSKAVKRKVRQRLQSGILKQFHCGWISYEFEIPREFFNVRAFSRKTGVKVGERWNAGVYPNESAIGYHVHFKGIVEEKVVRITVEYFDGAYSVNKKDEAVPSAEEIMGWIGSFASRPEVRAFVSVGFEKPNENWKSRFNLPFKVTTSNDLELTIDGVSILLPRNDVRALHAYLTKTDKVLRATVAFTRSVRFSDFDISREITSFNRAVNIFAEHTP